MRIIIYINTFIDTARESKGTNFAHIPQLISQTTNGNIHILPRLRKEINITAGMTMQLKPLNSILRENFILTVVVLDTSFIDTNITVRRESPKA